MHCFSSGLVAECENLARLTVRQKLQLLLYLETVGIIVILVHFKFDQKGFQCCVEHGSSPALAVFGDEEQARVIGTT